jgi:hypothetical protein
MAVINELLRKESNGAISFGNHKLAKKAKLDNFQYEGDLLKVKTFQEITKLEKNGMFLYESVPGTSVMNFLETAEGLDFVVEGEQDAQITVGLMEETDYEVFVDGVSVGVMNTGLSGKLNLSVELETKVEVPVKVVIVK